MKHEGKVAIVTGAAQGIGRACAERLLADGASVVISDVNLERLNQTAEEIGNSDKLLVIRADVAVKEEIDALIAKTVSHFGQLDIMVNNAGIAPVLDFLDVTEEIFDATLDVNLKGAFFGTQAAGRQMIAQERGGAIINMSSINSGLANPSVATYAISKGGMNQVTSTAAVAFAPHNIRVCGVGPGTIMTEMVAGAFVDAAGNHAILSRTPLGRYGKPEEIASVVSFLASDDASFITGETIYPDGGRRVLNYTVPVKE